MVLKRLFSSRSKKQGRGAAVPNGQVVYAIGDIHGRLDLLEDLLRTIERDECERSLQDSRIIFLGDLVDRGPDSRGVIERLIRLKSQRPNTVFLLGNHDEVFLKAVKGDVKALRFLTKIGGKETILSYGVEVEAYETSDYDQLAELLAERVPQAHCDFLESFDNYAVIGDYLFVHAGIRPGIELINQTTTDLRWIRGEFLNHRNDHGFVVVHGHSITEQPDVRENRVGIDTGAFASGRLTAIGLEGSARWFLCASGTADPRWGAPKY